MPLANIDDISVALDTYHFEMLPLKDVPRANIDDISVALDTYYTLRDVDVKGCAARES